jgi:orotidine-5'-phosphate decarboxylase
MNPKKYIYCAIDYKDLSQSKKLLDQIQNFIGGIKLGLEFFVSNGLEGVKIIKKYKLPIFLDLKLHDIPNTVNKAMEAALSIEPHLISVHVTSGSNVLKLITKHKKKTKIIGVTMLTSLEAKDLKNIGVECSINKYVEKLAKLAYHNGLDGIVCSPKELSLLRNKFPRKFIFVTPGIRLKKNKLNDQKRILEPGEAIKKGSNIIVIGRPITEASKPVDMLKEIIKNIQDHKVN